MTRTMLISTLLVLTPVLAQADCNWHQKQAAMTCADGLVYDAEAAKCVKLTG